MADEGKDTQGVSIEEYNKLKSEYEKLKKNFQTQSEKQAKLEKIFDERQTKTLDKEGILKALGLDKAPEKPIAEVLNEKFNTLSAQIEKLQAENKAKDEKLALNDKKQKILEAAKSYNFIDTSDVLNVIDFNDDDIEGQVKKIAETKKHWIKPKENLGGAFNGGKGGGAASNLEEQLREAQKNGNVEMQIALKRQIYERQKI